MASKREQTVQAAERYVSKGKLDAAIKEYRKVLDSNPNDLTVLNRLGDLYVRRRKIPEALELFSRVANHYAKEGFYPKAIAIHKKSLRLDSSRLEIYEKLAELYHQQGLVTEARAQYQVMVDYYLKHDRVSSAIGILEKMVELEPEDLGLQAKLAELCQREGEVEKALLAYRGIAQLMLRAGHGDKAAQVYIRALNIGSDDLGFISDAVLGLKQAGHVGPAARLLAVAVEKNPKAEKLVRVAGLDESRAAADPESGAAVEESEAGAEAERDEAPSAATGEPDDLQPERGPEATTRTEPEARREVDPQVEREVDIDLSSEELEDLDIEIEMPGARSSGATEAVGEASPEGAPAAEDTAADGPSLDIDEEALERTAAELTFEEPRREEDLLAEAEVFAKYGLREKAEERLRELLQLNRENREALALLANLCLEEGYHQRVPAIANRLADLSGEEDELDLWKKLSARLEKAGYRFEKNRVAEAPSEEVSADDTGVSKLLRSLTEELEAEPEVESEPEAPPAPDAAPPSERETPREATPEPAARPGAKSPAVEEPTVGEAPLEEPEREETESAEIELDLDSDLEAELEGTREPERETEPFPAVPVSPEVRAEEPAEEQVRTSLDDTGTSWLDEVGKAGAAAADEQLFEEEGFFDLAAELEKELDETGDWEIGPPEEPALTEEERRARAAQEQSLEDIVEGFRKGVAQTLSPEDYDTHYNLGIAYREMGLLDEAIGEFQLAAKDSDHLVDACSMLGLCFLEKGLVDLAIKWYRRGLEAPDLAEEQTLGLLYDMGEAYLIKGDREAAYKTFVEIYGTNSNYRDVVARLEELGREFH